MLEGGTDRVKYLSIRGYELGMVAAIHEVFRFEDSVIVTSVAAWVFLVINAYVSFQEDRYGNGRHLWDVTGNDFTNYLQYLYASHILYNITIFTTKLSILLLYLRVFDPNERSRLIFQIVLYANLIFYTIGLFLETFRCSPLQKIWVPLVEPGQCLDQRALQLASCVFNFISDAVILCLPIATIWQLRLSHKSKYGVVAIFSVGILTAEFTAGIIVGCLPAVPAFIRHLSRFNFKIVTSYVSEHSGTLKRPLQQLTASPRVVESHSDQRPSWEMARIETPKDQL
ncbi:MAG: hypothetical protein Q9202_002934 [Teloschistes flavicans]